MFISVHMCTFHASLVCTPMNCITVGNAGQDTDFMYLCRAAQAIGAG